MNSITKKVMAARTALVLDQPFFGVLALRLKLAVDPTCKTAWVDGRTLGYNPSFVDRLTHSELVALLAHEVMHCATGHPWRRDSRDPKRWNVAADHAINPILIDSGFKLPEGALFDPANRGKSAEWIYARQPQPQPEQGDEGEEQEPEQGDESGEQGGAGGQNDDDQNDDGAGGQNDDDQNDDDQNDDGAGDDGQGDEDEGEPEQPGEVRDAPADTTEDGTTEADWQAAVQQAANAAKAQGKLSGALARFAADAAESRVDWRSALRRFVQETTKADYTWKQPSSRYVARGLYMPALRSEEMGPMVVAIDTSGSIDEVLLAQFEAELRAIVDESNPARVHVMYCDAEVKRTDTFERGDLIEINAVGGGGTKFGPVFDAVEELDEPPACLVYLTDLQPWGENGWPAVTPEVPTLWAATVERDVPFGEVLPIN